MNKTNYIELLNYYIEYETYNRRKDIVNDNNNDVETKNIKVLEHYRRVEEILRNKKHKKIQSILTMFIKELSVFKKKSLIEEILLISKKDEEFLLNEIRYIFSRYGLYTNKFVDNYILEVIKTIKKNEFTILGPTVQWNKKLDYLISFTCELNNCQLIIKNYQVNQLFIESYMEQEHNIGLDEFFGTKQVRKDYFNTLIQHNYMQVSVAITSLVDMLSHKIVKLDEFLRSQNLNYIFITSEIFNELKYPPFKEEMILLKSKVNNSMPKLLQKYLCGNKQSKRLKDVAFSYYFGSYTKVYPVNQKQWEVANLVGQNDLIAVSGPPGTGKTTLAKEIIADNIVRKVRMLIDNWDKEWKFNENSKKPIWFSPFILKNKYSIVVSSVNNDAVNNIGKEFSEDISKVQERSNAKLKYKMGATLGKKENVDTFLENSYKPFINSLSKANQSDDLLEQINEFKSLHEKVEVYNNIVKELADGITLLRSRNVIGNEISVINKNDLQNLLERYNEIEFQQDKMISKLDSSISEIKRELLDFNRFIEENNTERRQYLAKKRTCENDLSQLQMYFNIPLIGKVIKAVKGSVFSNLHDEIVELNIFIKEIDENITKRNMALIEAEEKAEVLKGELSKIKTNKNETVVIIGELNKVKIISTKLFKLVEIEGVPVDNIDYILSSNQYILSMRNRLFELSIIINQAYIIKNKDAILYNLATIFEQDYIMKSFYRINYTYDEYELEIRQLWETLGICFPVITTTLHSFERNKFHMIKELFDTLIIDEAGQILPYYILGPMYRCRKAIVVGDTKQLEPIRKVENYFIDSWNDKIPVHMDANINSVQDVAECASDVFEDFINGNREGLMLNEHRRCEPSIADYSNHHVYDNKMKIIGEDKEKAFLESNVVFIDIRGKKGKDNTNNAEATMTKIVTRELLEYYDEKDIAVIVPYKKQKETVIREVNNNKIAVETIHTFQGKEKKVVIVNLVLDSEDDYKATTFIGNKANMLNVAFTRAKGQLIVIGNYDAISHCKKTNFLHKTAQFVRSKGTIFSIYETKYFEKLSDKQEIQFRELMRKFGYTPNVKYEKLFGQYVSEGGLIEDDKHYQLLKSLFYNADKSITVVSPWIAEYVVNDEFLMNIEQFIKENKKYNIIFGYQNSKLSLEKEEFEAIIKKDDSWGRNLEKKVTMLKELYRILQDNLKYKPPLHTKALIIDEEFLLIGSHNWLAKMGQKKNDRKEITCIIQNKSAIDYLKSKWGK